MKKLQRKHRIEKRGKVRGWSLSKWMNTNCLNKVMKKLQRKHRIEKRGKVRGWSLSKWMNILKKLLFVYVSWTIFAFYRFHKKMIVEKSISSPSSLFSIADNTLFTSSLLQHDDPQDFFFGGGSSDYSSSDFFSSFCDEDEDEEGEKVIIERETLPSTSIHNGNTMKEFLQRTLSRSIAQSNVLIVSPDFLLHDEEDQFASSFLRFDPSSIFTEQETNNKTTTTTSRIQKQMLCNNNQKKSKSKLVLHNAIQNHHVTYGIPTQQAMQSVNLNDWWKSITTAKEQNNNTMILQDIPNWFLLAYFAGDDDNTTSIDDILNPQHVDNFFKDTTLTYIVIEIKAEEEEEGIKMSGLQAVSTLLDAKYKIQLLSSSHFWMSETTPQKKKEDKYKHNYLFKTISDVESFLKEGIAAQQQEEQHHQHNNTKRIEALLFATQGLDLAIPSRLSYLDLNRLPACKDLGTKGRCDSKLGKYALGQDVFMKCPEQHDHLRIDFPTLGREETQQPIISFRHKNDKRWVVMNEMLINNATLTDVAEDIWMSSTSLETSEAICARFLQTNYETRVACNTRILPPHFPPSPTKELQNTSKIKKKKYNFLSILIDPISRSQFQRSLPNTKALLEHPSLSSFIHFPHYTTVGNNSGPNQAALYSGLPLNGGRDGIKHSDSHLKNNKLRWLWDVLLENNNNNNYTTLKAEDSCIENSNMIQSMNPKTTHGEQVQRMFCFDYDRPNCLGKDLMAKVLLDYTEKFIVAYSKKKKNNKDDDENENETAQPQPWAAFLSFVDSHEDTSTLISYLDHLFFDFLQNDSLIDLDSTIILFSSDHGLHYGDSFRVSPKIGQKERAEPILYIHIPQSLLDERGIERDTIQMNQELYVTAFDVHETIMDALDLSVDVVDDTTVVGKSLLRPLNKKSRSSCWNMPEIPRDHCELVEGKEKRREEQYSSRSCKLAIEPPSAHSFYTDIPKTQRPSWPKCDKQEDNNIMSVRDNKKEDCKCPVYARGKYTKIEWESCSSSNNNKNNKKEIQLMNCKVKEGATTLYTMDIDVDIERNASIVSNYFLKQKQRKEQKDKKYNTMLKKKQKDNFIITDRPLPNILFIEIDSLSYKGASRHMPKTLAFLKKHEITINKNTSLSSDGSSTTTTDDGAPVVVDCPTGFCAAQFHKTSVVGASSKPNQLAALSGCSSTISKLDGDNNYRKWKPPSTVEEALSKDVFCPIGDIDNPWIFDIIKEHGYVDFFGEEFCYVNSIWSIPNVYFPLNTQYNMNDLYCPLTQATYINYNDEGKKKNDKVVFDILLFDESSIHPKHCIDGKSKHEYAFDVIQGIFDSYHDIPKFAFLSAIAAHDYSVEYGRQALNIELYDEYLVKFLEEMLSVSQEAQNTVIVLRGDHGIQGGPMAIDYSNQVEHMHPFNSMIVPASMMNTQEKQILYQNQYNLVTGHDLYATLRSFIQTPISPKASNYVYSYDLLRRRVPSSRTCKDARIPQEFCVCSNERKDLMPYFYPGYSNEKDKSEEEKQDLLHYSRNLSYNPETRKLFSPYFPGEAPMVMESPEDFSKYDSSTEKDNLCKINTDTPEYKNKSFHYLWKDIDRITSQYPEAKVSGGLFLYPKQTMYFKYIINKQMEMMREEQVSLHGFDSLFDVSTPYPKFTVCETGFGAGHSTAFWLSIAPEIHVVTFDTFDRPNQEPILQDLKKKYPNRITAVRGDSCKTVPSFFESHHNSDLRCNFIHGSSLCPTDNIDLVEYAGWNDLALLEEDKERSVCAHRQILTSTAMNSVKNDDGNVYFGRKGQWNKLVSRNCIDEVHCFQEDSSRETQRDYLFAKKGTEFQHQFCMAYITGNCDKKIMKRAQPNNNSKVPEKKKKVCNVRRHQVLKQLCKNENLFSQVRKKKVIRSTRSIPRKTLPRVKHDSRVIL